MRGRLVVVIGTIGFALTACGGDDTPDATTPDPAVPTIDSAVPTSEQPAQIGNPASQYCIDQGGTIDIVDEAGGQVGYCNLPNGNRVEEWELFRSANG
jgi:putative hemolysin